MTGAHTEKYEIKHWWTGAVIFTAVITCPADTPPEVKLGLAVKVAVSQGASLDGASLVRARLDGASLVRARLVGASLDGASLDGASLVRARLDGASLVRARLDGASLDGASLDGARLVGAKLPHFQIPQEGEIIGYKKTRGGVVKLRVPPEARRTISLVGRKCRAEFVEVLEGEGIGSHDGETHYAPGLTVYPDSYDDDIRVECTHGIHFFLTRQEAEEY